MRVNKIYKHPPIHPPQCDGSNVERTGKIFNPFSCFNPQPAGHVGVVVHIITAPHVPQNHGALATPLNISKTGVSELRSVLSSLLGRSARHATQAVVATAFISMHFIGLFLSSSIGFLLASKRACRQSMYSTGVIGVVLGSLSPFAGFAEVDMLF